MQDTGPLRHAHVSTSDLPERNRLAMWREIYGRGITNVDIEPIGDGPFHAEVTFNLLPGVSIAAGSRSPAHYRVPPALVGRGNDIIALSVLLSGAASSTQFGEELISGIGSASVLTPSAPSTSTLLTDGSFITLALSRPLLAALAPDQAFGRPIPSSSPALRLLIRYLEVVRAGDELTNPAIGRVVSDHIIDLAALALGARGDRAEIARLRGAKAARLSAIMVRYSSHPRPQRPVDGADRGASRHFVALRAKTLRRGRIVILLLRPRRTRGEGPPHADRPEVRSPQHRTDRPRKRIRRCLLFQPCLPPSLRRHALGFSRGGKADVVKD